MKKITQIINSSLFIFLFLISQAQAHYIAVQWGGGESFNYGTYYDEVHYGAYGLGHYYREPRYYYYQMPYEDNPYSQSIYRWYSW